MLKGFQRPSRMIPGGDQNDPMVMPGAQQLDGVQRVFPRGQGFVLNLDRSGRDAGVAQDPPIDDIVAFPGQDDGRGVAPAVEVRGAGRAVVDAAAENDHDIRFHIAAVHAEKRLRVEIGNHGKDHHREECDQCRAPKDFSYPTQRFKRKARRNLRKRDSRRFRGKCGNG